MAITAISAASEIHIVLSRASSENRDVTDDEVAELRAGNDTKSKGLINTLLG